MSIGIGASTRRRIALPSFRDHLDCGSSCGSNLFWHAWTILKRRSRHDTRLFFYTLIPNLGPHFSVDASKREFTRRQKPGMARTGGYRCVSAKEPHDGAGHTAGSGIFDPCDGAEVGSACLVWSLPVSSRGGLAAAHAFDADRCLLAWHTCPPPSQRPRAGPPDIGCHARGTDCTMTGWLVLHCFFILDSSPAPGRPCEAAGAGGMRYS